MTRQNHNMLTATQALGAMERGELTPRQYIASCRDRIGLREDTVRAWVALSDDDAVDESATGLLAGIPVGVKDIYETRDLPTRWGTDYLHAPRSPADAAAVALLRRAGACLLGKTVSTELAYFTPGKTRNPHDPARTPGGSSSGSAAAVADGMVPIALGTQTAGSITRPASFCGVVGFKPSFGTIPTGGVKQFSGSLDTPGWFARSVEDIALVHGALTAGPVPRLAGVTMEGLRVAVQPLPANGPMDDDACHALVRTATRLREAGATVVELQLPEPFDAIVDHQVTIMAFEAARSLADEFLRYREQMGARLVTLIEQGLAIPRQDYIAARQAAAGLRLDLLSRMEGLDVLLAPSAIGEAPVGHDATGDPVYARAWTLLGFPTISLPLEQGSHRMPIGMQCIARPYEDERLLAVAHAIMTSLGQHP